VPITHTNAKGQTFSLYQGTTKTGKPKYYFAMQSEGTLAQAIPAGYEIYENLNAQVFLRRIPPKIITDAERHLVEVGMRTYAKVKDYKIDVKGNALLIYTAVQEIDALVDLFKDLYPDPAANVELMANLRKVVHYSPMLVFQLVDGTRRTFQTQHYCFLGSVDDWIEIGKPGKLSTLVKRYVKHLGQDSYVELW
jgi:hypothetical protein